MTWPRMSGLGCDREFFCGLLKASVGKCLVINYLKLGHCQFLPRIFIFVTHCTESCPLTNECDARKSGFDVTHKPSFVVILKSMRA